MKSRCVLIGLLIFAAPSFAQQGWKSLHQAQADTEVEGSFALAGKVIPLPPGKFTLVSGRERRLVPGAGGSTLSQVSNLAEVFLVQTQGSILRAGVWASANVAVGGTTWTDEPCKRSDTFYKLDRLKTFQARQDCVLVNHVVGLLSSKDAWWVSVHDALKSKGVVVPIPIALRAEITRIELTQGIWIQYWFNPDAYGYPADAGSTWATSSWHKSRINAESQKTAFVQVLSDWAVALKPVLDKGFKHEAFPQSAIPALRLPTMAQATTTQQGPATNPSALSTSARLPEINTLSLEASNKECAELGFGPGTEDYGKCVLRLSR